MQPFQVLSTVDQLAAHLRAEIQSGGLSGEMPGVAQLVKKLGVGTTTVVAALNVLKREGYLEGSGARRRARIVKAGPRRKNGIAVRVLLHHAEDRHDEHVLELEHELEKRRHRLEFAGKALSDLRFEVKRVAHLVKNSGGDAWIIFAGSRDVLEWFSQQSFPAFAMFGRQTNLPIASFATLKSPAVAQALRRLVKLGHHRIVLLTRAERRKPTPGLLERRFLTELESLGLKAGAFNLPHWEDTPRGLHHCLDNLFRLTPPTAIFLSEPALFYSTQQYLLRRGFVVPRDVSLISLAVHPSFAWFHPEVSHIRTDTLRGIRRAGQWVDHVANGKDDRKETLIGAEFIEGGTIGPAK